VEPVVDADAEPLADSEPDVEEPLASLVDPVLLAPLLDAGPVLEPAELAAPLEPACLVLLA
jgi:hypothetical protein